MIVSGSSIKISPSHFLFLCGTQRCPLLVLLLLYACIVCLLYSSHWTFLKRTIGRETRSGEFVSSSMSRVQQFENFLLLYRGQRHVSAAEESQTITRATCVRWRWKYSWWKPKARWSRAAEASKNFTLMHYALWRGTASLADGWVRRGSSRSFLQQRLHCLPATVTRRWGTISTRRSARPSQISIPFPCFGWGVAFQHSVIPM